MMETAQSRGNTQGFSGWLEPKVVFFFFVPITVVADEHEIQNWTQAQLIDWLLCGNYLLKTFELKPAVGGNRGGNWETGSCWFSKCLRQREKNVEKPGNEDEGLARKQGKDLDLKDSHSGFILGLVFIIFFVCCLLSVRPV